MIRTIVLVSLTAVLACVGTVAFGGNSWGVQVGTASYYGSTQLTSSGLPGSDIEYAGGGYDYTRVESKAAYRPDCAKDETRMNASKGNVVSMVIPIVPEPASIAALCGGLVGLVLLARRR